MKKKGKEMDDFDFGFTAVTEGELAAVQQAQQTVEQTEKTVDFYKQKADNLYNMIMPLLNNLAKNPEKDYIYWPNRMDKIEQFSDKLNEVYKG
jgi:uncharacterized protein Yka (UPF0111/DUF47 family)